jgi:hypothetical protein
VYVGLPESGVYCIAGRCHIAGKPQARVGPLPVFPKTMRKGQKTCVQSYMGARYR